MKITDLTANRLIRLEVRDELIPLREINYRDVRVGDIFVINPYWADEWTAIQVTGKFSRIFGEMENLLEYDVYHINDDGVVLDITGHRFAYAQLLKENWKWLGVIQHPIIALNYPGKPLNSRKDN